MDRRLQQPTFRAERSIPPAARARTLGVISVTAADRGLDAAATTLVASSSRVNDTSPAALAVNRLFASAVKRDSGRTSGRRSASS